MATEKKSAVSRPRHQGCSVAMVTIQDGDVEKESHARGCSRQLWQGEKDWQKYEETRHLKGVVDRIHTQYRADWKSPEMKKRQWAAALYFIDKCPLVQLALQTGNKKEEGETADTVGCCSLRVEHIWLHMRADGREHVVELDFLGKDSISYHNRVTVEKLTSSLNKHLQDLMDRLTAKVFRTYNASITLQEQLQPKTA